MQYSFFATAAATAFMTLGAFSIVPNAGQAQPTQAPSTQPQLIANASAAQSGQFVTAEHETKGTAKIVTENGQRYLEFDAAFRSDNGPDLFVLLHREGRPTSYENGDFIRLGRLQNTSGKQRYVIPADVSINEFKSAVIWCRAFNATFGFATFG